jgi:hypothetical protein
MEDFWVMMVLVNVAIAIGIWMGYDWGYHRGFRKGRKQGSHSMSKVWMAGLTGNPKYLDDEVGEK